MAETERNFHLEMWFEGDITASLDVGGIKGTQLHRVLRNAKRNKRSFAIHAANGKKFQSPPGLLRYKVTEKS